MMRTVAVLAMVAGVLGTGAPAWAQLCCTSCCAVTVCPPYYLVASTTGCLSWGGERYYSVTLRGGVSYHIVLRVPWGADFDMKVYDENGNLVGSSTRSGSCDEIVTITPIWTGPFIIKVYSYSGSGCFTLQLYRR